MTADYIEHQAGSMQEPQGRVEGDGPEEGYPEHPLFPNETGSPETRDIQFISFRRRRHDGRIDNCPEDIDARDIVTWADVIGPFGGGEYKAIGKDKNHRIVAWYPPADAGWLLFDQPSKPFKTRDGAMYAGGRVEGYDTPAPLTAQATPAPQAPAAAAAPSNEVLVAALRESAETTRSVLQHAFTSRENPFALAVEFMKAMAPRQDASASAVELLRAYKEVLPAPSVSQAPPHQPSIADHLHVVREIRDMTIPAPAAPPAAEPSVLGELSGLITSLMQTDAMAKASKPPEAAQTQAPPPPPRPHRFVHVPGLGLVDVVQPEPPRAVAPPPLPPPAPPPPAPPPPPPAPPPAPAPSAGGLDLERLLQDPVVRQRVIAALGVPLPATPAPTAAGWLSAPVPAPAEAHVSLGTEAPPPRAPSHMPAVPQAPRALAPTGGAASTPLRARDTSVRAPTASPALAGTSSSPAAPTTFAPAQPMVRAAASSAASAPARPIAHAPAASAPCTPVATTPVRVVAPVPAPIGAASRPPAVRGFAPAPPLAPASAPARSGSTAPSARASELAPTATRIDEARDVRGSTPTTHPSRPVGIDASPTPTLARIPATPSSPSLLPTVPSLQAPLQLASASQVTPEPGVFDPGSFTPAPPAPSPPVHAEPASAEPFAPPPDQVPRAAAPVASSFADDAPHAGDEWVSGTPREPHASEPLASSPTVPLLDEQELAPQPASAGYEAPAPRTVRPQDTTPEPLHPAEAEPEGEPGAVASDDGAILLPAHMPTFSPEQDAAIEDAWPESGEIDAPSHAEQSHDGPPAALVRELRTKLAQLPGFGQYADQLADLAPELPEDALTVMLGLLGPDPLSAISALQTRTGT